MTALRRVISHSANGSANTASPTMPLSTPIDVMPIWIVDRKRVGSSPSLAAAIAAVIALVDELLQSRATCGDERDLRHREQAIEQNEDEEDGYGHAWDRDAFTTGRPQAVMEPEWRPSERLRHRTATAVMIRMVASHVLR